MGAASICVYGVELLVKQLKDSSLTVASTALSILDEVQMGPYCTVNISVHILGIMLRKK